MERWRRHAIEQIEQSVAKTDKLARHYRKQSKSASTPKIAVSEFGVWHPRRWNACMASLYENLSAGGRETIEQLENGAKR